MKLGRTQESIYNNTQGSILMFRARFNSLPLKWRKRFTNEDTAGLI